MVELSGVLSIFLFILSIILIIWGISLLRRKSSPTEASSSGNYDESLRVSFNMHIEPEGLNGSEVTYLVSAKIITTGGGVLDNISLYIAAVNPDAGRGMVWDERMMQVADIQGGHDKEVTIEMKVPVNQTVSFRGKLTADGIEPLIVKTENVTAVFE